MLIFHGYGKLTGGPEKWAKIGESLQIFGIDFYPVFLGFYGGFCRVFLLGFHNRGGFLYARDFFSVR